MKLGFKSIFYAGMIIVGASSCSNKLSSENAKSEKPKDKLLISMFDTAPYDGMTIQENLLAELSSMPDSISRSRFGGFDLKKSDFAVNQLPWDGIDETRDLTPEQCVSAIVDSVEKHIEKNGRMTVLAIAGHGQTNQMALGDGNAPTAETPITRMNNFDLLKGLGQLQDKLQHEGKLTGSIADKIILGGCSVFAGLTQEDAAQYNSFAKKLGTITGSTVDIVATSKGRMGYTGNFAVFDGKGPVTFNEKMSDLSFYATLDGANSKESVTSKTAWVAKFNDGQAAQIKVASIAQVKNNGPKI